MNRPVGAVLFAAALLVIGAGTSSGQRAEAAGGMPALPSPAAVTEPGDAPPSPPSPPPVVTRRIDIQMIDTAFAPAALKVNVGETIAFVFTNTGKQTHDAFIGDKAAQEHHEQEMRARKDPNDHHGHEGGVIVPPGQTGSFRYFFDKPGTLEIGCHQPYHYDLGMKVLIEVVPGVPQTGSAT
jgi:uncharacterized cupredoxin-like copper-binding protein